ncbi:unnamed protein product [Withania somnifera]
MYTYTANDKLIKVKSFQSPFFLGLKLSFNPFPNFSTPTMICGKTPLLICFSVFALLGSLGS